MRTNTTKRASTALVIVLAIVLVSLMGFTVFGDVAYAAGDESITLIDEISVGHLSDIHYFPLEHCYQDVYGPTYKISDFYHSTTGDTKLVVESGIVLNATIKNILKDADDHKAPQYLVASGDLSKNGERVALIDVANSLRYLQNEMREKEGYENFQVFATVGNHDLYNHNGALYSQEDGSSRPADMVTAMQFAMIFAGLGFPNADVNAVEGKLNLTEYLPAEYWSSEYTSGYVMSENAPNLEISYYSPALTEAVTKASAEKLDCYLNIGDGLNQLTYFASRTGEEGKDGFSFAIIDSADREDTESGALVRISEKEYQSLDVKPALYLEKADSTLSVDIDTSRTVDASVAFSQTNENANVYRRTPVQHITGGRITTACLDWVEQQANAQNSAEGHEETIISSFHHNVLPHFEQEDDILKDFTLYNWEYTAKRFLDMGIRYALTGHMHASDAMSYTDAEGRTLYDFETGSIISYASPRRYLTFERNDCDGKLGERTISEVHVLGELREIASDHINTADPWDDNRYQAAIAEYNAVMGDTHTEEQREAAWQQVIDSNPAYLTYIIRYDEFQALNDPDDPENSHMYNDFISQDIYTIIVDRMVDHFINESTINGLLDSVHDLILGLDNSSNTIVNAVMAVLGVDGRTLDIAADYMIDTVLNNLYGEGGYPFKGNKYPTALKYVLAVVNDILDLEFGDANIVGVNNPNNAGKMNVREIASFIMMSHSAGAEIDPYNETAETIARDFEETPYVGDSEQAQRRFKQPTDKIYRLRMLAAIKEFDQKLHQAEGGVVEMLLDGILDPLFNNSDSLLKTLLNYKFDFSKANWDDEDITIYDEDGTPHVVNKQEYAITDLFKNKLKDILSIDLIKPILTNMGINITAELSYDATSVSLNDILGDLLPALKPVIANMMGFNMVGDSLIEIVENLLSDYVTPSFKIGLGGIASNIVMAFATDVYPDVANMTMPGDPFDIQPYGDYKYADKNMSYVSGKDVVSSVGAAHNAATQLNGRVPSRVTANFDTVNSTTAFTVKFYTEEDVYGMFRYKTGANGEWITLSTSKATANANADYFDSVATRTDGGITVRMVTQTKPVYLPLIDLGLLCLTHAEVDYEVDKTDVPYKYGERDNAPKNSIVYWNVTTVTITGLSADTTYYYDILGSYVNGDVTAEFSFTDYNKTLGYAKDYFTFTTAKASDATSFEFLTIADIQGMIEGMYKDSFDAVTALLADDDTKNFDFILNAGDMCDNGKNFNQWSMALDTYQTLFANSSMFFAAGNHEKGSNALANYFNYTLPNNTQSVTDGMYYSFNYGNAHFIVLNTNDASASGLGAEQLRWLNQDLTRNSSAKWKFVLMHKSIFSGGSHSTDAEVVAMRDQLVPIFANAGVNIVFGGHDHTYTSTHLVDKNGNVHDRTDEDGSYYSSDGVLYITLGTMGTKFYNYQENDDILNKFDEENSILETLTTQTFGKVKVDGDKITYTAYKYNPTTKRLEEIGGKALTSVAGPALDPGTDGNKGGLSSGAKIGIGVAVAVVVLAVIAVVVIIVIKKKQEEKRRREALRRKKIALLKARKAAEAAAAQKAENEHPSDGNQ